MIAPADMAGLHAAWRARERRLDARVVKTVILILTRMKVRYEDLFPLLDRPGRPPDRMTPEQITAAFYRWHAESRAAQ